MDPSSFAVAQQEGALRVLEPHWNTGMNAAAIAISLVGAFTSTQLMCQARLSYRFTGVLVWTVLGSLTFGFCSVWCLHFVAMVACELDLPIGINVPLTILSAFLAVFFTFAALASDLLWDRYCKMSRRWKRQARKDRLQRDSNGDSSGKPLLHISEQRKDSDPHMDDVEPSPPRVYKLAIVDDEEPYADITTPKTLIATANGYHTPANSDLQTKTPVAVIRNELVVTPESNSDEVAEDDPYGSGSLSGSNRRSSEQSTSRRSSSFMGSSSRSYGLGAILHIAQRSTAPAGNAFVATGQALYAGSTKKNILKGFLWSLAITSMHYVGIAALQIPDGFYSFSPILVVVSGFISWVVCLVGCILMTQMESHLSQQLLFSVVATIGVAAMHFTGMKAVTFWSHLPPSDERGFPEALAVAIVSIAIITCIGANGLLAHAATVSRNKLAEIVLTRKELWRTIAQKENAEAAAAARSDFIASASHEIRTPLHHLQGYSDLLSRTELTEEGRMLLCAIQRATKTLSLITNNVLDWSKLERDDEAACRPVSLDMRTVCESVIVLLPNKDDEAEVELLMVVAPDVPHSLYLDETYIHRILMNLLSNAMKFTRSGYILLLVEMKGNRLVATVTDTGSGVPPSFLPQLFEPFKQAQTLGSQRGTGLGLSIIRQLLHKMLGDITVESRHPEAEDVEPDQTGSTFTITIPIEMSSTQEPDMTNDNTIRRIAIFHGDNERALEGLQTAWEKFGFEVASVKDVSDLQNSEWGYIWADVSFLQKSPTTLRQLAEQDQWLVLVPFDAHHKIHDIPEIANSQHFIPLSKPLIWHSFKQRIAQGSHPSSRDNGKACLGRSVRFASKVDILERNDRETVQEESTLKNLMVLLVEDNPINQKLGKKMLTSLGYQVTTADDGQNAIDEMIKHDGTIDMILMDQSMPGMDGVTATRKIRDLEADGTLSKITPIIAVTAVVNGKAQADFKAAGADDFLAKPLSLLKLNQTLAQHLLSGKRR